MEKNGKKEEKNREKIYIYILENDLQKSRMATNTIYFR